jgi:uridine phosphorylase
VSFTPAQFPILEYDSSPTAFIEPSRVLAPLAAMPAAAVLCFFHEVVHAVGAHPETERVYTLTSEIGPNPVYAVPQPNAPGGRVAVVQPGVGAPLAAGFMDELIALGVRCVIAVGGAGALVPALTLGHAIVPTVALRDDGTSYHYVAPSRTIAPHPAAVNALRETLRVHGVPAIEGAVWTTDGLYRETPARIAACRAEGAICVEMEMAALCAVGQFRGVPFGQLLYGGDTLAGDTWDSRHWVSASASTRERLFWLAAEAAGRLAADAGPAGGA